MSTNSTGTVEHRFLKLHEELVQESHVGTFKGNNRIY